MRKAAAKKIVEPKAPAAPRLVKARDLANRLAQAAARTVTPKPAPRLPRGEGEARMFFNTLFEGAR